MLVLPLNHPLVLLPGARISLALSDDLAHQLSDAPHAALGLTIAATPITNPKAAEGSEPPVLNDWACAALVTKLVRPSVLSQSETFVVTLLGKERVRVKPTRPFSFYQDDSNSSSDFSDGSDCAGRRRQTLPNYVVDYPPAETTPKKELITDFKGAALKLLDRLVQDAGRGPRRGIWTKFSTMVEDISDTKTPWLADVMVWSIITDYDDRLAFLSLANTDERLQRATELFVKQTSISEVTRKIASAVDESLSKQQKEFFLRQQLAAIQRELANLDGAGKQFGGPRGAGDTDDEASTGNDLSEIKRKLEMMEVGSEERKMGEREWKRLKRMPQQSAEHGILQNYLEWLTSLPWPKEVPDNSNSSQILKDRTFLTRAREQLDADHYGLDNIKKRLIEYLAVLRLRQLALEAEQKKEQEAVEASQAPASEGKDAMSNALMLRADANKMPGAASNPTPIAKPKNRRKLGTAGVKGPILLFVGPPGTGKTSLGQSIARALNRPFQRISLGGVRDEAEIRGHRRTYIASGPGLIAQALRKAGRLDPVLLLDEIDKVGPSNYHGDVASALLEVLDPEQNHSFNDHYINVPLDLSQILFIGTANTLETMSPPLLDRCEIVSLAGYTYPEKIHIARRFLLPKQLRENVLESPQVKMNDEVLQKIVSGYTREAGVRSLERAVGAVVRSKAVEWAEAVDSDRRSSYDPCVRAEDLEGIIGIPRWDGDERERESRRGVVYGLVVMGAGEGGVLPVETTAVPGEGKLKLTGSLGDVIRESGELALSWVKAHAYLMGVTGEPAQDPLRVPELIDVHLHLPAGAQKKDGPSAGVAMTCALVSLLTGALVPSHIAMTGEITLRGLVTPVGGIKEKVLGAHRAGVTKLIMPMANRREYEHDVPQDVKEEMEVCFVRTVEEALESAFGRGTIQWRKFGRGVRGRGLIVESRL